MRLHGQQEKVCDVGRRRFIIGTGRGGAYLKKIATDKVTPCGLSIDSNGCPQRIRDAIHLPLWYGYESGAGEALRHE
jgi:hypothetical protein